MNTILEKLLCIILTLVFALVGTAVVVGTEAAEEQTIQSTGSITAIIQTNTRVVESTTETTTKTTLNETTTTTTQPITTKAKEKETTKPSTSNKTKASYSQDDLYVLSHIISAEARGESDECQLAVGSVVLNRVASKDFPNTIYGVVFQKGQYSPTWNGSYYNEPTERAVKNAKYLLENGSVLPSGVVYQAQFVQGTVYKKIGTEYFCYG